MTDGVIKNDGTSRLIKAALPATYEELRTMAAAGTLPMDILFNAAGWDILPTFLNKASLLSDAVAALGGLGEEAVPDDVLRLFLTTATRGNLTKFCVASGTNYFNEGFIVDASVSNTVTIPEGVTAVKASITTSLSKMNTLNPAATISQNGNSVLEARFYATNSSGYGMSSNSKIIPVSPGDVFTASGNLDFWMLEVMQEEGVVW